MAAGTARTGSASPYHASPDLAAASSAGASGPVSEVGKYLGTLGTGGPAWGNGFDPVNGVTYQSLISPQGVMFIDPHTDSSVGFQSLPGTMYSAVYDPADNMMYGCGNSVSSAFLFNAQTNAYLGSVGLAGRCFGIGYDPADQEVYASLLTSPAQVEVLRGTDVVGAVQLAAAGSDTALGVAYDPVNQEMYVGVQVPSEVAVVSGTSLITTIATTGVPYMVGYDPQSGLVFVTTARSTVEVIDPVSNRIVATPQTGYTYVLGLTIDTLSGNVYLIDGFTTDVIVMSSGGQVLSNVTGGSGFSPYIGFNPVSGQIFGGIFSSGSGVLVISTELAMSAPDLREDGGAGPLGAISVGSSPQGMAVDPSDNYVWVAQGGSNNVGLVSAVTQGYTAGPATGTAPEAVLAVPAYGVMFVANSGSGSISSINTVSGASTSITVGTTPDALCYDPVDQSVYVSNFATDSVSVYSLVTSTVVASVPVGIHPDAIAYDPARNLVVVANEVSNNLTVINATYNSVKANLTLPGGSAPDGLIFDMFNGSLVVAYSGTNAVVDLNISSGWFSPSIPVVPSPKGLAFAPNGTLYVAGLGGWNVSLVDLTTYSTLARINVSGVPQALLWDNITGVLYVSVAPASGSGWLDVVGPQEGVSTSAADLGQIFEVQTSLPAVGTGLNSLTVAVSPSTGTSCTQPFFVASTQLGVPNLAQTNCVAGAAGSYFVWINDTDSSGASVFSWAPLTVYADPTVSVSPSTRALDVGQTVVYSTSLSGGSGSFPIFNWTTPASLGCPSSSGATLDCAPTAPATGAVVSVRAQDSTGMWTSSATSVPLDVFAAPAVVVAASAPSADVGQTLWLNATFTGGNGTVGYAWTGLPPGCTGTATASVQCLLVVASSLTVTATATDANGFSVSSAPISVPVSTAPKVVAIASTVGGLPHISADVDQTLVLTATVLGGSGTYLGYAWSGLPSGCTGTNTAVVSCVLPSSAVGILSVSVRAQDSNNAWSVPSAPATVTVSADPALGTPSWTPSGTDVGQSVQLVGNVSSVGAGIAQVTWVSSPSAGLLCVGGSLASTTATCTATKAGSYTVNMTVTDANGFSTTVASPSLAVSAFPIVSVSVSPSTVQVGSKIAITAAVSGSSGGLTFVWSGLPAGCAGTGAVISCAPSATGTFSISVAVTDAHGARATSPGTLLQVNPAPAPTLLGMPAGTGYGFLGLLLGLIVLAVLLILLLLRGRGAGAEDAPTGKGKGGRKGGRAAAAAGGATTNVPPGDETAPSPGAGTTDAQTAGSGAKTPPPPPSGPVDLGEEQDLMTTTPEPPPGGNEPSSSQPALPKS